MGFRLLQRSTVFRPPESKLHIGPIGVGPLSRRVLVFLYQCDKSDGSTGPHYKYCVQGLGISLLIGTTQQDRKVKTVEHVTRHDNRVGEQETRKRKRNGEGAPK